MADMFVVPFLISNLVVAVAPFFVKSVKKDNNGLYSSHCRWGLLQARCFGQPCLVAKRPSSSRSQASRVRHK